jgi:hypothetical protein
VQERSSHNVTGDVVVVNDDCPQRRLDVMQTDVDAGERLWSRVVSMLWERRLRKNRQ